jgi:hypothetical protein
MNWKRIELPGRRLEGHKKHSEERGSGEKRKHHHGRERGRGKLKEAFH